jgi:hypothetical protein
MNSELDKIAGDLTPQYIFPFSQKGDPAARDKQRVFVGLVEKVRGFRVQKPQSGTKSQSLRKVGMQRIL